MIEARPRILLALPEGMAAATAAELQKIGIIVRTGTPVVSVSADGVTLKDGEFLPAEMIVWTAGIKAPDYLAAFDGPCGGSPQPINQLWQTDYNYVKITG